MSPPVIAGTDTRITSKQRTPENAPKGLRTLAQGCGTPLPWVGNRPNSRLPQRGCVNWGTVLENRRNSVGVEKREGKTSLTQGSGIPQPWALFLNPVGILNSNIRFSPLLFIAKKMWVMTRVVLGNALVHEVTLRNNGRTTKYTGRNHAKREMEFQERLRSQMEFGNEH